MVIYAITTFEKVDKSGQFPDYGDTRTVGYYNEHSIAEDIIKKNTCDIFEDGYYNYACITEIKQGLYKMQNDIQWFEYNADNQSITTISKPELLDNFDLYIFG